MTIGEVARRTGLRPSALRFYEKSGLLPPPPRASKRRNYDASILGRIEMVRIVRASGFSVAETRRFLAGFPTSTKPSARWKLLAERKRHELDVLIADATRMKSLLDKHFRCDCATVEDCADRFSRKRR